MTAGRRILIFGTTGQLGRELTRARWPKQTRIIALGRPEADFTVPRALGEVVRSVAPDAIVIAAGFTHVDAAETNETLARTVNADAPAAIAAAAADRNLPVIYPSTDYVFDGRKSGRYDEDDPVAPLGAYGRSKAEGEQRVRFTAGRHAILRTAWLYSPFGLNFVRTMLRVAADRPEVAVVGDQHGCPTAAADLAAAIVAVVGRLLDDERLSGTFHAVGTAEATWYDIAAAIFTRLERLGLPRPRLRRITTGEYPTAAVRPRNSRLATDRLAATFGCELAGWPIALPRTLSELLESVPGAGGRT